ncbi:MAG: HAMP domain-containing histidine kinase [Candidatus Symbiothrix sp.]|jgi:two-component system phosphate regulon sensor histidine kinase PhoR|nr:HAMP domain-containing histidine kinase [Candidatus Symbiothrix sp.]
MEKRIKLIFILTIIVSLAVIAAQTYWLFNQYLYLLQHIGNELFEKTLKVAEADRKLRDELKNKNLYVIIRANMEMEQNSNSVSETKTGWNFEIYIITNENAATDAPVYIRYDSLYIDSLYKSGKEIKKYQFEIAPSGRKHDAYDALDRFLVNEKCIFTTERLDSLLRANELIPIAIQIETTDSTVWNPDKINHTSIFRPALEVTYPFNILQKQQFRVSYSLNVWTILKKMILSLICSVMLSFLLIFCLVYQINTIFRQQRIEELRKNFIHTMIHELKRPLTALKLCISFMKNDKMMQDTEMKEEIFRNSHNELDNLSSYFSKLRDVMADDLENIPLNISIFNLKELIEQCIEKQTFPNDREFDIKVDFENDDFEIAADKMHIENIICNLLENAVKYTGGKTLIRIVGRSAGDKYLLEISDNGSGISETERNYVFDRFFRCANATEKNIPGIGLGLFYVKLLVRAHKGEISLQSTLGKGSTFIIEIPKKQ